MPWCRCSISFAVEPSLPLHYQPPAVFSLRYAIGDCLGSGGFGFVCAAAVRGKPGVEVAVKFILKEKVPVGTWARDEQLGIVPTEIYFLKRLNHPNIIKFIDCFEDALYFLLVTEVHGGSWSGLCPKPPAEIASDPSVPSSSAQDPAFARRASCDLFECIELLKNFTEPQAQYVFRQLISVVAYLESVGVLHRDIKDENVLINDSFEIKLIDFGSASFVTPHKRGERMFLGTLQYAPPEILEGRCHQGAKCEVWSLACCLYIMLVGEAPFTSLNEVRLSPPRSPRDRSIEFSPQCENLLAWMFEKDPARRPSISQVLFHPWLSGL
ncbi:kinase-like domain-containing protein [Zopfochytrium polystomum]|nr:kinase-like domain-containing protein [Zopfochytrium polystomum]